MTAAVTIRADEGERRFRPSAEWLRVARDRLGLTQAELGARLGVARSTIVNAEAGRSALATDRMLEALVLAGLLEPLS